MFAKVTRPIGPDETSDVVERDLAELGASLLLEVIDDLAAGTAVEEPQDDSLSTYASKVTKDEGLIDWTLPADRHPQPRPRPVSVAARVHLPGRRAAHRDAHATSTPGPTSAAARHDRRCLPVALFTSPLATRDGSRSRKLQPEGRRAMKTRDYLAGHPIQPGARFSGR